VKGGFDDGRRAPWKKGLMMKERFDEGTVYGRRVW
jgi:hypothetical protein